MALIDKLPSSNLGLKGANPPKFSDNPTKLHELGGPDLRTSQLDLDGLPQSKYSANVKSLHDLNGIDLRTSQLDLNGQTPSNNYRDNAPEGQFGRI